MQTPLISILLPSRNEFPNLIHTIYSILHCLEADGFDTTKDVEILISNNCSNDEMWPQRATGGTTDFISSRGMYWANIVRFVYDPIPGNHKTTNKLVDLARGKYVFRSDAHMAYKPGFFKRFIETAEQVNGVIHTGIPWMGAYPRSPHSTGMGYTISIGEGFKATWNNYNLTDDKDWFYIPSQGHASVGMTRKLYKQVLGYNKWFRTYGGGEWYFDWKCWMLGIPVIVEPRCSAYHLSSGRGYSYTHDDFIYNTFLCGFSLGADMWVERSKINWMRNGNKEKLDYLWDLAKVNAQEDARWIEKNRKMTFNEMLVERPWDKLNDEKHGKHFSAMKIFHYSWLELMRTAPEQAKEALKNATYQKELSEFIETKLKPYIYAIEKYDKIGTTNATYSDIEQD